MQTTLRLDDELYRQAKARAAALGISLTRFLEDAVREHLEVPAARPRGRRLRLPVSSSDGGLVPGFSTLAEAVAAADLAADRRRAR
jgi:ribbon-helix-helix CopG family protein